MNATLPGSSLKDFSRILSCFSKVSDEVNLEVKPGKLLLSTLNASKSAFILITLNATRFDKFEFLPPSGRGGRLYATTAEESTLRCKLQLRSLLSIFRPRQIENKDGKDGAVEKCELKLLHPSDDASECQLLIRLVCKHGIRKTYKLQYEQTQTMMYAVTDKTLCFNHFALSARTLKDVVDHFAPRAEELTLAVNDGQVLLTSFTEGVTHDKEVLKQPIHTSISIDRQEFDVMEVDEQVQITFGLREFKSFSVLCDLLGTELSVMYSDAGRPLIVEFDRDGITGEFVVATTADGDRGGARRTPMAAAIQTRSPYRPRNISAPPTNPNRSASRRNASSPPQSALFAPDPDADDPAVIAHRTRLERSSRASEDDQALDSAEPYSHHAPYDNNNNDDDDEMMLYADESTFDQEDTLGPTQTQSIHKPKGLFD